MVFLHVKRFVVLSMWLSLGTPSWILLEKVKPWWDLLKWNKNRWVFLFDRHFPFRAFDYPLGSYPGSLSEKAKSWKDLSEFSQKVLRYFCLSIISSFVALVVLWDPILDPGGKSDVLIRFHKIQSKLAKVFLHVRRFVFLSIWLSLGILSWILVERSEALIGFPKIQ